MSLTASYIVAARRSAIGRVGGLHHKRRVEELASPIVEAALKDAGVQSEFVDEVIVGNTTAVGENPARLIALASGLSIDTPAYSIDRQCASGLEAVMSAVRLVATGGANIVLAGGAESPSTAPWRVIKPKSLNQMPRFVENSSFTSSESGRSDMAEAAEELAEDFNVGRSAQDSYALRSHQKALAAHEDRRFVGEIVPHRIEAKEARDEAIRAEISMELLAQMPALFPPEGTITHGNSSVVTDGAAFTIVVSEGVYQDLGRPPALRVIDGAAIGVQPELMGVSAAHAVRKMFEKSERIALNDVKAIELSETFAVHALAAIDTLGVDEDMVNRDGGAIAIGHPFGASSAVMVTRLFSQMVRQKRVEPSAPEVGLATMATSGGLGVAALFQAVG